MSHGGACGNAPARGYGRTVRAPQRWLPYAARPWMRCDCHRSFEPLSPPPVSAALVEKQQASEQAATIVSQPLIAPAETEEEKRARQAAEKAMADPQVRLVC